MALDASPALSERAARLRGIYAILDEGDREVIALARDVLAGGVRIVQYRAKRGLIDAHVRALREMTRAAGALLILNDFWRAVAPYDADGAHVGPDDCDFAQLRQIRSALADRLLGVSCGTPREAQLAQAAGADYAGVGAVYATASKADAGEPIGIAGLTAVAQSCALPIAAIGGLTRERLKAVRGSGAAMAALISAFTAPADAQVEARALVRAWEDAG